MQGGDGLALARDLEGGLPGQIVGALPLLQGDKIKAGDLLLEFDRQAILDAGYDLVNDFDGVMRQLDDVIGLERVKAVHVNDSQFGLSSHKDRHANIGDGHLGIPFFTRMVNDPRLSRLPMILETKELTETTHREEIALLRGLVQ